ncbi:hypothetical protein [Citrobacter sedlakii]|uniref:hypothetical protein n=1 Tax=Citrobacter sedlakii TaxID=67826 RepID=UPI003B435C7E
MFSLLVKWPEKAVSGSSRGLAQLSFLLQVEKAACVTFPLCAVKVTHWHWCSVETLRFWCSFTATQQQSLLSLQTAARKGKRR